MRVLPRRVLVRSAVVAAAAGTMALPLHAASAAPAAAPASAPSSAVASSSAATLTSAPTARAASSSSCGASFTRAAKTHTSTRSRPLVDVRAGKHACFDRLVLEFRGRVDGYDVRYVKHVYEEGSGEPVALKGRARLKVTVVAPSYDSKGNPTYTPADRAHVVDVGGYRSFRQVAWAGSFEGYTTLGVGVRRSLPFRVFVLKGPGKHTRIVLDVAHQR